MDLHNLEPQPGAVRNRRRVGRGPGSGRGKTAGRGHKGRGSRSGGNTPPGYEGGQMPLQRRVPKRGFRPVARVEYAVVNLRQLAGFPAGSVIDPDVLRAKRLVRGRTKVKCLGSGTLAHALTVRAHAFSASARDAITAAGGTAEVVRA
ncbi:MAG TPA: 50S ribosomal protein L15 [Candidatus Limnocylindria bacterium]|nr:50S ribosomal protein L15 [Candidatus Limnocylindria bacterium]